MSIEAGPLVRAVVVLFCIVIWVTVIVLALNWGG